MDVKVHKFIARFVTLACVLAVGLAGAPPAHAAKKWWETSTTNVYTIYPYWSDYTSKYPDTTLKSVTDRLDQYRAEGFNALLFQPLNAGDPTVWAGLAALKHEDIAPDVGSLTDYRALLSAAHSRGMKVMMFYNLGFASNKADFFVKACADFSAGRDTPERNWFVFSHSNTDPKPNGWTWVPCGPDAYYLEYWDVNAPAYDWTNPAWRAKAKEIVEFWMGLGTDGMSFDAVPAYYGITQSSVTTFITDVLNQYDGLGYAEGVGVDPGWITNYHFPALEDYAFSAQWARPTPVANAIFTHDPSALEGVLNTSRDRAVNAGGILWSPIEWGRLNGTPVLSPAQRALESATVASVGALTDWHDTQDSPVFEFWNSWSDAERQRVFDILKAGRDNPALGPVGERLRLPTNDDHAYYAFKRASKDGTQETLVILNFTASPQKVTVDLAGSGIGPQRSEPTRRPRDLINGGYGAPITSSKYSVRLPAYGYTFLGLGQRSGTGGSVAGAAADSSPRVDLSSEGSEDWAHWGRTLAQDFDHKSGVTPKISNYTKLGTGTVTRFTGNTVTYSWSGGTPTPSASDTDAAVFIAGNGNGFRLTVPADRTRRTFKLYVGAWQARVRVHAYLSDGSAPAYTDRFDAGPVSAEKTYTLSYSAGVADQSLIVDATVDSAHDPVNGNVTLQAATLASG
jgi:hypothetical protein